MAYQMSAAGRALTEAHTPHVLPPGWTTTSLGDNVLRHIHLHLTVIVTAEVERDGRRWLHVSVSHRDRLPDWHELRDIKDWLIGREALALQVLPPTSQYVNIHPRCLHLWHCLDGDPVPDFRHDGQI